MQPSLNEERLLTVGQGSHQSTVGPKTSITLQNCLFALIKKLLKILMKYNVSAMQFTRVGTYLGKVLEYHSSSSATNKAAEPLRHLLMQPEVALSRSSKDFRKEDSSRAHQTYFKI